MLMKLAHLDNEKIGSDIAECCEINNAHYVPIVKNQFGILTDDLKMTYGTDDSTGNQSFNSKVFVDVYKCATDIIKRRKYLLWTDKSYSPYNGKILDNLFFKRLIEFCYQHNIFVSSVRINSEYKSEDEITEPEDIQNLLTRKVDFVIEKVEIELKNKTIIFDKVGYVDIGSKLEFYEQNQNIIINMLKVGFEE